MQESSTRGTNHPSVLQFRWDLEIQLREQIREAIETVLDAELTAALGSARHERTERREGDRHSALERAMTTGDGVRVLRQRRSLPAPLLVVTDGHAGLKKALQTWSTVRLQRCTMTRRS